MRKVIVLFSLAALVAVPACNRAPQTEEISGTVTVSGAWALYPMVVKWAEEFQKIHPTVKIDVAAGGAGKGMADCLAGAVDIGMISREINSEEIKKGAWFVPVTIDAVVPTVNAKNPLLGDLLAKGAKRASLVGIWVDGSVTKWGQVAGTGDSRDVHVYTRSDACGAAETWAKYLGANQEDLTGTAVYGDPGLAEAVRQDDRAIGFNNINYAFDPATKTQIAGIAVLPLDLNENGVLDADESFYGDRDALVNAIATGKYPSPPARDLYFAFLGAPERPVVRAFVRWVLTDGQQYVPETGYVNLSKDKLDAALAKLGD